MSSGGPRDALDAWLDLARIESGSVFRAIDRWGMARSVRLIQRDQRHRRAAGADGRTGPGGIFRPWLTLRLSHRSGQPRHPAARGHGAVPASIRPAGVRIRQPCASGLVAGPPGCCPECLGRGYRPGHYIAQDLKISWMHGNSRKRRNLSRARSTTLSLERQPNKLTVHRSPLALQQQTIVDAPGRVNQQHRRIGRALQQG